jgi:hypothetical protein
MNFSDVIPIVREVGFPGALLVAIFYACWKWVWWLLTEVIKPVATKAIESMEHLSAQSTELVASTNRMCNGLLQVTNKQVDHDQRFNAQGETLREIQEILNSRS